MRSIVADWERGDFTRADWADPEVEWVTADGPAPGSWTGVRGMGEASRDWFNSWEGYRVQAHQFRELDDGRVLVLFDYAGRGKTSGLEIGQLGATGAGVFHVRSGRVTRVDAYWDGDRALADLGLAPEGG